ncbi:MAG: hypothetical protein R3E89_01575 [Thiolinea sp.]
MFKWVAMLLMFGIAFAEYYMHDADEVNWVFVGFCIVFGFILLWTGHILAQHSIAADQRLFRRRLQQREGGKADS